MVDGAGTGLSGDIRTFDFASILWFRVHTALQGQREVFPFCTSIGAPVPVWNNWRKQDLGGGRSLVFENIPF